MLLNLIKRCSRLTLLQPQCLGLKPVNEAYDQLSVSTKIGGLGIRRIVDHAKGAFTASWFEAQVTTHESWVKPDDADCSADYATQRKASRKCFPPDGEEPESKKLY